MAVGNYTNAQFAAAFNETNEQWAYLSYTEQRDIVFNVRAVVEACCPPPPPVCHQAPRPHPPTPGRRCAGVIEYNPRYAG